MPQQDNRITDPMEHLEPSRRKTILESGMKHPFWAKFLKPYLQGEIRDRAKFLRTCALGDVKQVRGELENLEALLSYPEDALEMANSDIEMARQEEEQFGKNHFDVNTEVFFKR